MNYWKHNGVNRSAIKFTASEWKITYIHLTLINHIKFDRFKCNGEIWRENVIFDDKKMIVRKTIFISSSIMNIVYWILFEKNASIKANYIVVTNNSSLKLA